MSVAELPVLLGALALAAASGLNPWIPLLGISVAARTDVVPLSPSFEWLGADRVLAVLVVLFVLDLVGDKVPVLDHALHLVGLVVAPASGAVVLAAQRELTDQLEPWVLVVAGMVLAGVFHLGRSSLRPLVTLGTGGAGNPVASALEDAAALCITVLSVLVPVVAFVAAVLLALWAARRLRAWRRRRRQQPPEAS